MTEVTKVNLTESEALDRFQVLFHSLNAVNDDIKSLSDQAKEDGLDVTPIKAAAKILADQKEGAWEEKMQAIKKYLG